MIRLILLLIVLSSCGSDNSVEPVKVDSRVGLSFFAIMQPTFNCETALAATAEIEHLHLAVLWRTFGTDTSCLEAFYSRENLKTVEYHLINEVCQRNGNCGDYELFGEATDNDYKSIIKTSRGLLAIQNEFDEAYNFFSQYPSVKHYISLGLESNLEGFMMMNLANSLDLKGLETVARYGADISERHHIEAELEAPCIANLDGQTIKFDGIDTNYPRQLIEARVPEFVNKFKHCKISFLWNDEASNCIHPDGGFLDPRERSCDDRLYKRYAKFIIDIENEN